MDIKIGLSNPDSGMVAWCDDDTVLLLNQRSRRWELTYVATERKVILRPAANGSLWGRLESGTLKNRVKAFKLEHAPHFGWQVFDFTSTGSGGFECRLPMDLKTPRTHSKGKHNHAPREQQSKPVECNVIISLGGQERMYRLPAGELFNHALDWEKRGYGAAK